MQSNKNGIATWIGPKALFYLTSAVLACLVTLLGMSLLLNRRLAANTHARLHETVRGTAESAQRYFSQQADTLYELGALLQDSKTLDDGQALAAFDVAKALGGFSEIRFVDEAGKLQYEQDAADISGEAFFQAARLGEQVVGYLPSMADEHSSGLIVCVPVEVNGRFEGALYASLTHEMLRRQIAAGTFGAAGIALLLSPEGRVICSTDAAFSPGTSFLDAVQAANPAGGKALAALRSGSLLQQGSGTSTFQRGSETLYVSYLKLAPSFVLLHGVTESAAAKLDDTGTVRTVLLAVALVAVFIGLLAYVFYSNSRHIRQLQNEKELLKRSEERYRFLENLTRDVIFEIDMVTRRIVFNQNGQKLFGLLSDIETLDDLDGHNKRIYPEDREALSNLWESVLGGEEKAETRLRVYTSGSTLVWLHVQCYVLRDEEGIAVRILGKVSNVDQQQRELQRLQGRAAQDSLTKVYNRETTQMKIAEYLMLQCKSGGPGLGAMLVVDLDGFKRINDTYGHLTGDHLLIAMAECMRNIFRSTDIVGRMGGDEFVIFLKDIGSATHAFQKGEELCTAVRALSEAFANGLQVSCSVGVCICAGAEATTFDELYQKADSALYLAKSKGKNQCLMYQADACIA